MEFREALDTALRKMGGAVERGNKPLERFRHEVEFASRVAAANSANREEWEGLILKAVGLVGERLEGPGAVDVALAVREAEEVLAPLAKASKQYTIHCVGHAHIDMNWLWPWPETVSVANDTFRTIDRLMEEFPDFRFSQSQASVYLAMKEYHPEVFERVKQRIREGRWEVTASTWVEGDKNLASGEILCRHFLYTKRWLSDNLGLPLDAVTIDWECDTFGHAHTLPGILRRAGVKRYYFHRAGPGPRLFWWQGRDGSRVLAYDDGPYGYNGRIEPAVLTRLVFEFERAAGLKDVMFVHGVGDHGGGPTRQQLQAAEEMNSWPVFPNIKFSTTQEFFSLAEREGKDLPVVDAELNFVFRGCYTSQSNIKLANRLSENALYEAEVISLLGAGVAGVAYPAESLWRAWSLAMFNQFHDILPGSGIHATYEYSQGLLQEILAHTGSIRSRGLRALAAEVNTASLAPDEPAGSGPGLGAGVGEGSRWGALSTLGAGAESIDPFLIFNPSPWPRSEVVTVKVWNRTLPPDRVLVRDDAGGTFRGQVVGEGHYWGHRFISIAFPAREVPALGYRTYAVEQAVEPPQTTGVTADASGRMENEFLQVQVEPASGAITHLIDKQTGYDFVPPGARLGFLQLLTEVPHAMTAWEIGQVMRRLDLVEGAATTVAERGPHQARIVSTRKYADSTLRLSIILAAGSRRVEFVLNVNWLERGSPEVGVPMLRVAFPLSVADGEAAFEIPAGYIARPTDGQEVPALRWADLSGAGVGEGAPPQVGATLLNDTKYGHSVEGNTICLTLLRSSYDPDPLPELGEHEIRYALLPHVGPWDASAATQAGCEFNHPLSTVATDLHEGKMPTSAGFVSIEPSNIMLSGLKKAEDSDALIVRLYETEGKETRARVRLDAALATPDSPAVETDLLEQPLETSTAKMRGETLEVTLPPFGIATVRVGGYA